MATYFVNTRSLPQIYVACLHRQANMYTKQKALSCHSCIEDTEPAACFHMCPQFVHMFCVQMHETHKMSLDQSV